MRKNCFNCKNLSFEENDYETTFQVCLKDKNYNGTKKENKKIENLQNNDYLNRSKKCHEAHSEDYIKWMEETQD